MIDFSPELYEEQPGDSYVEIQDQTHPSGVKKINLNAIEFYAKTGMKPHRFCHFVGTTATAIWENYSLKQAYNKGAAFGELYCRQGAMEGARRNPKQSMEYLERFAGTIEQDMANGVSPEDVAKATKTILKLEIEDNSGNPEIKALKDLLDSKVAEAEAKQKT